MVYGREGKKHSMDLLTRPPGTAARKRLGTIEITSVTVIELDTVPSPSRTALTLVDLGTLLSSRIVFFFFFFVFTFFPALTSCARDQRTITRRRKLPVFSTSVKQRPEASRLHY